MYENFNSCVPSSRNCTPIKVIQMSLEMLSAVDKGLRNNDDLKAKNLKTKLLEQYTIFA